MAVLVAGSMVMVGGVTSAASAAESHGNCIQFDQNGTPISVTPSCAETVTTHTPTPQSFPAANPCTGAPGMVTETANNQIEHVNVNKAGDFWITSTGEGTVIFTPDDPTAPSGTGHFTQWFGTQSNNKSFVTSFTMTVVIQLTDGSQVTLHQTGHTTITPNGPGVTFTNMTVTC